MSAIDRVIQMGRMMSDGKADINTLMNAAPAAAAEVHKINAEIKERANIRADANNKWEKTYNQNQHTIDMGRDSQTNSLLAGITPDEIDAAMPHFTWYTPQGKADAEAIKAAKMKTKDIKVNWNDSLKSLNKDIMNPNMSLEEKESAMAKIEADAGIHNFDLKNNSSYISTKTSIVEERTKSDLINTIGPLLNANVSKEVTASILSNSDISEAIKKQLIQTAFKSGPGSANDIQAWTSVLELSGGGLETPSNPLLSQLAQDKILELSGADRQNYETLDLRSYKSNIPGQTVDSIVAKYQEENPNASLKSILTSLQEFGDISK